MSANNIVINFDASAPNIIVSPAKDSAIEFPFTVFITSDEPATVYYRFDHLIPIPGQPGVNVTTTPFQFMVNANGEHRITLVAHDDVGNVSDVFRYKFIGTGGYTIYGVSPTFGFSQGGTQIEVSGDGYNPGSVVLLNKEELSTRYISPTKLVATTLPLDQGVYDVQVNDPVNGLSIILPAAYSVLEKFEERVEDDPLLAGETRKHVFETTEGPMVLTRENKDNFDANDLVELQIKELGVALQIRQNYSELPKTITTE